jgi:hypothetical protein
VTNITTTALWILSLYTNIELSEENVYDEKE